MHYLGLRSDVEATISGVEEASADRVTDCFDESGRPIALPSFNQRGEYLLAGYRASKDSSEHLAECETIEDMQGIFEAYAQYGAIKWYIGIDRGMETITEAEGTPTA